MTINNSLHTPTSPEKSSNHPKKLQSPVWVYHASAMAGLKDITEETTVMKQLCLDMVYSAEGTDGANNCAFYPKI